MINKCPGAKRLRQPKPEIIRCPSCGEEVEIWTDEVRATCPNCKIAVVREEAPSCLDWCRYAKECVGEGTYNKYMQNKAVTIKQKLLNELEGYLGNDTKRIKHAQQVLYFAEKLLEKEKGDWHIVIPAGILHDIGIKEAERKYGSSASHYQEKEGPPIAKEILLKMGLKKEDIDEICQIIAHHHSPQKINTQNFRLLYDADSLVNLKEEVDTEDKTKLKKMIDKTFLTSAGKDLAEKIYLPRTYTNEQEGPTYRDCKN
jgi:HD superfamily phosphodiesterase/predicted RNA-binding Zn-ribbon protein involved in translation (DUF1610 family)